MVAEKIRTHSYVTNWWGFFFLISFEIMEVIRAVQASLRDFILAFLPCRIVTLHGFHERESK